MMKKLLALCLVLTLALTIAGCAKAPTPLSLSEKDFSAVSQVKLYNCHNGESTLIGDPQSILDICAYIRTLSGASAKEQEGFYEGSYAVTLLDAGENPVFEIGFGDSDTFYCAAAEGGEIMRFDMDTTAKDIISFFSQYDASEFQW